MSAGQALSVACSPVSRVALRPDRPPPQAATRAFAEALNAAEPDRAASFFADGGCFVTPDATAVRGHRGIRELLAQLTASRVQLGITLGSVHMTGNTALCSERWVFTHLGGDAEPFVRASNSSVLLRRSRRMWQLSIVAPWHAVSAGQQPVSPTPQLDQRL